MAGRLQGKVAIITGGTSGIGESSVERFIQEGARVVFTGRSEVAGRAIAARLGANAVYCKGDVTRDEDLTAMVDCATTNFGRLDVLFNNAGFSTAGRTLDEIARKDFEYDVNLLLGSIIFATQRALPLLRASGGGSVINNASIAGMRTGYGPPVYSACKAAAIHITRFLAMELAPERIRVNAISPGAIQTPIFGRAFGFDEQRTRRTMTAMGEILKEVGQLHRAGVPQDIANAAVYLASDEAEFVTGENLVVDGGAVIGRNAQQFVEGFQRLATVSK